MSQLTTPPKFDPTSDQAWPEFRLRMVSEAHHYVLSVIFLSAAFTILYELKITVIPLLIATRWLATFGLVGFGLAYLVRKKLGLSLLDGLYYNVFGIAPVAMAAFLVINSSCTETYVETHPVSSFTIGHSGYTYQLQDSAYQDYWRFRNVEDGPNVGRPVVSMTVCNGIFGYKVVRDTEVR